MRITKEEHKYVKEQTGKNQQHQGGDRAAQSPAEAITAAAQRAGTEGSHHRLCKRGGIVEKPLPDLINLTDEQFDAFVEKTLLSGHAERILKGLIGQSVETVPTLPTGTKTDNVPAGSMKPPEPQRRAG